MPYGFRLSEVRSVERLAQERLAALNAADPLPVDPQEREGRGFIRTVIVAALTDGARRAQELAVYMGGLQGRAIVSASPVRRDRLAAEVAVLRLYLAEAAAAMAFVTYLGGWRSMASLTTPPASSSSAIVAAGRRHSWSRRCSRRGSSTG